MKNGSDKRAFLLEKGKKCAVPVDFTRALLSIRFKREDLKVWSDYVNVEKLGLLTNDSSLEVKIDRNVFILIRVIRDTFKKNRTTFLIEAPLTFRNCLPT